MVSVIEVDVDGQEKQYALSFCGAELREGEFIVLDRLSCFWLEERINNKLKNSLSAFCVSVNFDNKTVFCDLGNNNG